MSTKELLCELKKESKELEIININNKEELLKKLDNIKQTYNMIINIDEFSDEAFEAMDILTNIAMNKPSLDEWIEKIINLGEEEKPNNSLINEIRYLIKEINTTQNRDFEYIQFLELQLQDNQKSLMINKDLFDTAEYQRLMNDINESLNHINQLYILITPKKMVRALSIYN